MKKFFTIFLILFIMMELSVRGQIAVGYNTDGNTLCLSYSPINKLWGEFRINTKEYNQASWSYSDLGITQVYCLVSVFSAKDVVLYAGGGLGVNLLSKGSDKWLSVNIPIGLKVNPFNKFPDLYLFGEYDPMFIATKEIPMIHCVSFGFRYVLRKNE
jgi:hypothetical protein